MNFWHIRQAARVVRNGGVIAYPTEAVYGLGCTPWNADAVDKILHLKRRSFQLGFIVVAANVRQLDPLFYFPDYPTKKAVMTTWPGPVTWILPAKPDVPVWITGKNNGVAVRVSSHPVVKKLCELAGPLVSTSANPSGTEPAKTLLRARIYFDNRVDYFLPGKIGNLPKPTEIRDSRTGILMRTGG